MKMTFRGTQLTNEFQVSLLPSPERLCWTSTLAHETWKAALRYMIATQLPAKNKSEPFITQTWPIEARPEGIHLFEVLPNSQQWEGSVNGKLCVTGVCPYRVALQLAVEFRWAIR